MGYVFVKANVFKNVIQIINNGTTVLPGLYLLVIVVTPGADSNISIGTTPGGNELTGIPYACPNGVDTSIVINQNFSQPTQIYITGVVSPTTFKIIML